MATSPGAIANPTAALHVEGEKLRVVNVPEGRIEASPRLDFKLNGRHIDASGEVLIPYARLAPADLTNAVLASDDEVLVGAPPLDPTKRWIVGSNVKLVLGDQVTVDAFGLTAKLGGSITVRSDEGQVTRRPRRAEYRRRQVCRSGPPPGYRTRQADLQQWAGERSGH